MSPFFTPGIAGSAAFQKVRYLLVWPALGAGYGAYVGRISRLETWEQHLYTRALLLYSALTLAALAALLFFVPKAWRLAIALLAAIAAMYLGYARFPWQGSFPG